MAQINKPNQYFNTKLYTGNASSSHAITGVGFQPDWVWIKDRDAAVNHLLHDSIRGVTNLLVSNSTAGDDVNTNILKSFDTDGFTVGSNGASNESGNSFVSWNWLAGGTAPSKTYTVKVVDDSGNKYRFDDFGTSAVTLEISEGGTYTFDQADSSNSGHPLRFYTASDKTGGEYTTGVTTNGTPGSAGAYTRITVAASTPTLYYQCSVHAGMGGQANTPTTNSFSNFSGSIQSNISPNTTSGFSIVSFTGNATAGATIGHGLGSVPSLILTKNRDFAYNWHLWTHAFSSYNDTIQLNTTAAKDTGTLLNNTAPTSSLITLGSSAVLNASGEKIIAYVFAEKKGFSKFGSYTGNGSTDGTFVYTGFKPAFFMIKNITVGGFWTMFDNKRDGFNEIVKSIDANSSNAEETGTSVNDVDFLSNGIKIREDNGDLNGSGQTIIYMCFAENPLVGTNNIPATAR